MNIIEFSVKRRVTVAMFTLAVILFGFVSFFRLKINLLPELSYPTLTIRTEYPGAAPAEVENLISKPIVGRIKRISPVVDPSTGTVKVTIEARDPAGRMRPGMFARVNIIYDVHEGVVTAPKDAIIAEDRESAVFVVRDSTAYRLVVTTGYVNTTHIEVLSGLKPGDTVVTTGKASLKDSTKVQIVSR